MEVAEQPHTKWVLVALNGDPHCKPKKKVVNLKKNNHDVYASFLDEITGTLKPKFGYVRRVCTPEHGSRITDFSSLSDGQIVVACGPERFRRIDYANIGDGFYHPKVTVRKVDEDESDEIVPVSHNRRIIVSGRAKRTPEAPKCIWVYHNGDQFTPSKKVVIKARQKNDFEAICSEVMQKIDMTRNGGCHKFYDLEDPVHPITNAAQLLHGKTYIACGTMERCQRLDYGTPGAISPRSNNKSSPTGSDTSTRKNYQHHLPPLNQKRKLSRNTSEESSPNNSVNSKGSRARPRKAKEAKKEQGKEKEKKEEEVIPTKPRKHVKRTPDKTKSDETSGTNQETDPVKQEPEKKAEVKPKPITQANTKSKPNSKPQPNSKQRTPEPEPVKEVDYDKDEGGVFKAQVSEETKGAKEVKESEETETEVPVDQREAEEIEDEEPVADDTHETRSQTRTVESPGQVNDEEPASRGATPVEEAKERQDTPEGKPESRPVSVKEERDPTPEEKTKSPEPSAVEEEYSEEEHKAATKIQANFRGYQTRKQFKEAKGDAGTPRELSSKTQAKVDSAKARERAAVTIQAGYKGYKTRKDLKEKNVQPSADVSETTGTDNEDEAAVKIQAAYRGYQTRKQLKANDDNNNNDDEGEAEKKTSEKEDKEEKAAIAIQAGFRGYKVRKELNAAKQSDNKDDDNDQVVDDVVEEIALENDVNDDLSEIGGDALEAPGDEPQQNASKDTE